MEIDGEVITESNSIMQALEDRFPEYQPLLPPVNDPVSRDVPGLLRLEREMFGGRPLPGKPIAAWTPSQGLINPLGSVAAVADRSVFRQQPPP